MNSYSGPAVFTLGDRLIEVDVQVQVETDRRPLIRLVDGAVPDTYLEGVLHLLDEQDIPVAYFNRRFFL